MSHCEVYADIEEMSAAAAGQFAELIEEDLARYANPVVILSGGSTPRPCYERLAKLLGPLGTAVHKVSWVIGDERWVAVSDPASNEGMIRRTLLEPLGVPEASVVSWHAGSGIPLERARDYPRALRTLLGAPESPSDSAASETLLQPAHVPDLAILGIGQDGHTASLFPNGVVVPASPGVEPDETPVGPEIPGWTAAVYVPSLQGFRLTLTAGLLRVSRRIFFLASGPDKREALAGMLAGDQSLPAAWLNLPQTRVLTTRDLVDRERL